MTKALPNFADYGDAPWARVVPATMKYLAGAGNIGKALEDARAAKADRETIAFFEKAASDLTTLYPNLIAHAFFAALGTQFGFDRIIADGAVRQLPLNTSITALVGNITPAARLAPGAPVVLGQFTLSETTLPTFYAGVIFVLSKTVALLAPEAQALLTSYARSAMGDIRDTIAFGSMVSTATSIDSAASFAEALTTALVNVEVTMSSKLYYMLSRDAAVHAASVQGAAGPMYAQLSPTTGGYIGAIPVLVTSALDGLKVAVLDADQVAANKGTLESDTSDQADLQMVTDPVTGAAQMVSLFQSNSSGTRLLSVFGALLLNPAALSICEFTVTP